MLTTLFEKKLLLTLGIFLSMFVFPHPTSAQIVPELNNVLVPSVMPRNPGANQDVSILVKSYSIDLNVATLSWFINDTLALQGVGQTSFTFTTGGLGSISTITIVAEDTSRVYTQELIIRPAKLDLLWQAQTHTPAFYQGRKLPSIGSLIAIEAVPLFINDIGARIPDDELVYTWYVDGSIVERISGKGKRAARVSQARPRKSINVEVQAETLDGLLVRNTSINIPIVSPEIIVYENNPLLGQLYNQAVSGTYNLATTETKFVASPFFMSLSDRNASHITYAWQLDKKPVSLGDDRGSITVRQSGEEAGRANITVSVENTRDIFQKAAASFSLLFGVASSGSSF
ncbi:MAG: hypothetical protein OQJ98_03100 [Candidatus Pacebacteria bacterium]|nr:hypothetical protein [Candidatus Paceibacterota bacterium]